MDARRDIHNLVEDILGDDPRRALIAFRRLRDFELPWIEQRVVALARRNEWKWATIARLLGCTRQNVSQRFGSARLALRPDPEAYKHAAEANFARLTARRPELDDDEAVAW